jgi:DNA-binding Lrp family transcriptional regulator
MDASSPATTRSTAQHTAQTLYRLGFNVFPLPYGQKYGYPWKQLQFTRLTQEDNRLLTFGQTNLAVMCGRTSGNLFVIDCETEAAYHYHQAQLEAVDIPIWSVRTGGRDQGGHFYLRCQEGTVKGVPAGQRSGYEVRGSHCYVLAPPSLHPDTGRHYTFDRLDCPAPPEVSLAQLPWLDLELEQAYDTRQARLPYHDLSGPTLTFIEQGAVIGERNNKLFAAACDMHGCGYPYGLAEQLLGTAAINSGLEAAEIDRTLRSAYAQPRTPAKPLASKLHHYHRACWWVENQVWKGVTGQTDRAVMLACCQRAITASPQGIFRASNREVAEMARVEHKTAGRSLRRLCAAGILVHCGRDPQSRAFLYRFGDGVLEETEGKICGMTPLLLTRGGVASGVTAQNSDVAESKALGKTAFYVYQAMCTLTSPAPVRSLVRLLKLSSHQVYRALRRLREYDLVRRVGVPIRQSPRPIRNCWRW